MKKDIRKEYQPDDLTIGGAEISDGHLLKRDDAILDKRPPKQHKTAIERS